MPGIDSEQYFGALKERDAAIKERDEARADAAKLGEQRDGAIRERDEAREYIGNDPDHCCDPGDGLCPFHGIPINEGNN